MIAVIKNSKSDQFYSNLTKINRETQCLPDEVRAKIYRYGRFGYMLQSIDIRPSDGWISTLMISPKNHKMVLLAEATLNNFRVEWHFTELEKHKVECSISPQIECTTVLFENGIPQF